MSIQAAHSKIFLALGILLNVAVAATPTLSQAAEFESVCQVTTASGFCQETQPAGTILNTLPTPPLPVNSGMVFSNFGRPFSADSLWNVRPRQVTFGNAVIPTSTYYPMVGTGRYSTSAFRATSSDSAMTVYPAAGRTGVWDPDSEVNHPTVVLPRWPADTVPAAGSDGHADIIDVETGIVHSFWQLRHVDGRWTAVQYAWSKLDGRGWGDASHYFQGARAAGITSIAGVIRKHEINDGESQYYHALAMSLTYNGLSGKQQYVYPATSGDRTFYENTGHIPTGALMMLPPSFDTSKITNPDLRKVANTLKTFGAYVVDRNVGTPFYIYVENGADYNLHRGGWNSTVGNDLQNIRAALRTVTYAKDWVNALNQPVSSQGPMNLISMRGPWRATSTGGAVPVYQSAIQSTVYGRTDKAYTAESGGDRAVTKINWTKPVKGRLYEFKVEATNGGKAYLRFWGNGAEQFHSRALGDGQTYRFYWPSVDGVSILGVVSGIGEKTVVRAKLVEVNP